MTEHRNGESVSFRTRYKQVAAKQAEARRREREQIDRLSLWGAFKRRCGRASYRSLMMMIFMLLSTAGWTVLCALGLIGIDFMWELLGGLVLCPIAFVVFLRGWAYDRLAMLTLGWAIALMGMGLPWWINGMVMG